MTRYIKRHSLQARLTHGIVVVSILLLTISGLFVFIPALGSLAGADVVFTLRIMHRVVGVIFIAVPLISAIVAPKGLRHLIHIYFEKWDKDDKTWLKKFVPYMFSPKKTHMPDQHEVKSGQRVADGALFVFAFILAVSGLLMLLGTTVFSFGAGFMLAMRMVHDLGFLGIAIFGIAHFFLGAGIFQPYHGTIGLMFGKGRVSESDALYHWGYWAREEIEKGDHLEYVGEKDPRKG
jgi:formate dehydrogenase subunit gamma